MTRPRLHITAKMIATIAVIALVVAVILIDNFRSRVRLQEIMLKDFNFQCEELALNLNYFLEERKYDVSNLAQSKTLSTYFENQALGMTMEYGLRASLLSLEQDLNKLVADKSMENIPIYNHIFFVNDNGQVLSQGYWQKTSLGWRLWQLAGAKNDQTIHFNIYFDKDNLNLMVSAPCYFKDQYVGHIIALLNSQCLQAAVDSQRQFHDRQIWLMTTSGELFLGDNNQTAQTLSQLWKHQRFAAGKVTDLSTYVKQYRSAELSLIVPIGKSPFLLATVVEKNRLLIGPSPWHIILILTTFVVFSLVTGIVMIRSNTRNLLLNTHLDEEAKRRREIAQKNRQLADEIAERKKAQSQLAQYNQNLETRVEERTQELQHSINDLKRTQNQLVQSEKLAAIGNLAAGVAHEINTPTQYIGDNIHFLKDCYQDLIEIMASYQQLGQQINPDEHHDLVENITSLIREYDLPFLLEEIPRAIDQSLQGIGHVGRIVKAMKEFSHPDQEQKTPIDLNHAIRTTTTVARNEWRYVADLSMELNENLPMIPCHPGEINQVILNLIVNAAHAVEAVNDPNGLTRGKITIRSYRKDEWAVVEISDSGCGIPAKIQNQIFDPFFTTKEVGKGTGQGLAISYNVIVKKHQGKLFFESIPDQGTTFYIYLPISPQPVPADTDESAAALSVNRIESPTLIDPDTAATQQAAQTADASDSTAS